MFDLASGQQQTLGLPVPPRRKRTDLLDGAGQVHRRWDPGPFRRAQHPFTAGQGVELRRVSHGQAPDHPFDHGQIECHARSAIRLRIMKGAGAVQQPPPRVFVRPDRGPGQG